MLMTAPIEAKAADLLYIVLRKCSSNLLFKGTNYEKAYFKSYCTIFFSKYKMSLLPKISLLLLIISDICENFVRNFECR